MIDPFEKRWPIEIGCARSGEGAAGAVVQYFGGAQTGALRQEIETHPALEGLNGRGFDAVRPEMVARQNAKPVFGQYTAHAHRMAKCRQCDGDIGLRATDMQVERVGLLDQLPVGCCQSNEKFPETQDVRHDQCAMRGAVSAMP